MDAVRPYRSVAVVLVWVGYGSVEQSMAALVVLRIAVLRGAVAVLLWTVCCAGFAIAYVGFTKPNYVASVKLVLEHRFAAPDGPDAGREIEQLELDGQQVETQLRLIRSDSVLRYVFDTLDRPDLPGVLGPGHDAVGRRNAFEAFAARVSARRIGLSYVVEIAYRARDPREAARSANAIAAAYLRDRVGRAVEDAQVGAPYLKSRIDAILSEAILAAGNVRLGMVPGRYLPDADVQILGPAIEPAVRTSPNVVPILVFAIGFGVFSGLFAVTILQQARGTIRSRAQFCSRFAMDCIDVTLDGDTIGASARLRALARMVGRVADAEGAAAATTGSESHRPPAIGIVSWSDDPARATLAASLTSLLTVAGPRADLIILEHGASATTPESPGLTRLAADLRSRALARTTVIALPALARSFEAQALAPLLDATILVVAAHRTTVADVEAALRAFRTVGASFLAAVLIDAAPQLRDRRWAGEIIRRASSPAIRRDIA